MRLDEVIRNLREEHNIFISFDGKFHLEFVIDEERLIDISQDTSVSLGLSEVSRNRIPVKEVYLLYEGENDEKRVGFHIASIYPEAPDWEERLFEIIFTCLKRSVIRKTPRPKTTVTLPREVGKNIHGDLNEYRTHLEGRKTLRLAGEEDPLFRCAIPIVSETEKGLTQFFTSHLKNLDGSDRN